MSRARRRTSEARAPIPLEQWTEQVSEGWRNSGLSALRHWRLPILIRISHPLEVVEYGAAIVYAETAGAHLVAAVTYGPSVAVVLLDASSGRIERLVVVGDDANRRSSDVRWHNWKWRAVMTARAAVAALREGAAPAVNEGEAWLRRQLATLAPGEPR